MGLDAPWHWVILALIVVALFGYKKMPEMARSVGKSLRIFKTEIKGMADDDAARIQAVAPPAPAPIVAPTAVPPAPAVAPDAPASGSSTTAS